MSHRKETPKWLERRFERVVLENERCCTREIYFTVRASVGGNTHFLSTSRGTLLIPLLKLSRFSSIDLHLSDHKSREVEHTTMPDERALIALGLKVRWKQLHGIDVDDQRSVTVSLLNGRSFHYFQTGSHPADSENPATTVPRSRHDES